MPLIFCQELARVVQSPPVRNELEEQVVDPYTEDPGILRIPKFGQLYAVALHSRDYRLATPGAC